MNAHEESAEFEYLDAAGYPDGSGFLDEGTAVLRERDTADPIRDLDRPSTEAQSEARVRRDDVRHVYEATIDGHAVAEIRYDDVDGRVVIVSTAVQPAYQGRGIADELIAYALDDIRELDKRVTVYCPFVARFLRDNRQFSDLIDPTYPGR